MTYEESEKLVSENLHITGNFSKLKTFPYYIKHLVIVPKDTEPETQMEVYIECTKNGYNNKKALIKTGFLDADLGILIIGFYSGFIVVKPLIDYLAELGN